MYSPSPYINPFCKYLKSRFLHTGIRVTLRSGTVVAGQLVDCIDGIIIVNPGAGAAEVTIPVFSIEQIS